MDHLARSESMDLVSPPADDAAVLRRRVCEARARLDGLGEAFGAGEIDRRQLAKGTERIRAELAEVERELAELAAGTVLDGIAGHADAAAIWATLPTDRQRSIVDGVVTVTVLPGRRGGTGAFDPAYVRVAPKAGQR